MKFDTITNLILEGVAKEEKFANLVIGNANPEFSAADILRDPNDPTRGSKLYLSAAEEKKKKLQPGDPSSVRRQLRRINWVARKLIKKYSGSTEGISVETLTQKIQELLEQYQTKVLGWESPDKANTGYETRVIGNILLPPTKRTPQGKSVFIVPGMDPNAGPEDGAVKVSPKPPKAPRAPKEPGSKTYYKPGAATSQVKSAPVSAEDILRRFERFADRLDDLMDSDLKAIVKNVAEEGGTVSDILSDDRVKDVYDADIVKQMVRGMIKAGVITRKPDRTLGVHDEVSDDDKMVMNPTDSWASSKMLAGRSKLADSDLDSVEAPDSEEGLQRSLRDLDATEDKLVSGDDAGIEADTGEDIVEPGGAGAGIEDEEAHTNDEVFADEQPDWYPGDEEPVVDEPPSSDEPAVEDEDGGDDIETLPSLEDEDSAESGVDGDSWWPDK